MKRIHIDLTNEKHPFQSQNGRQDIVSNICNELIRPLKMYRERDYQEKEDIERRPFLMNIAEKILSFMERSFASHPSHNPVYEQIELDIQEHSRWTPENGHTASDWQIETIRYCLLDGLQINPYETTIVPARHPVYPLRKFIIDDNPSVIYIIHYYTECDKVCISYRPVDTDDPREVNAAREASSAEVSFAGAASNAVTSKISETTSRLSLIQSRLTKLENLLSKLQLA